jgi:chromatin assembly factor 1 subunit A
VKKLVHDIQGTVTKPIDLTSDEARIKSASQILSSLPVKYLKFAEDVRPPWIGTYSKAPKEKMFIKLARNPFQRQLPVNYDYDSEAEWEEPEEGEELNSEGEEEDDEDEEDMDGFLDDEGIEDATPKRKQLMGDMEPIHTSLHWVENDSTKHTVPYGNSSLDLSLFRLSTLAGKTRHMMKL